MRSALSLSIASALLVTAPLATAIPTRVPRDVPPPVESQAAVSAPGATTIRLHRRGSAELMQEDGSIDFGKSHAHLARARAKYVRGLRNFELNTGEAHFLSPGLVDPSLLPTQGGEALVRRDAWGSGEEDSLDWAGDSAPELVKRGDDKVFGAGARLHGVPPPSPAGSAGPVANKRALAKRAVKNPKAVWNPKAHAASTTSSAAAAKKTGGVALTDYDGTLYTGVMSIGTPAKEFIIDFDTGSADLWVPSSSCNSAACNPHTKYDASGSSTSKAVAGKSLSITYGDGSSTRGTVYTDTVTFSGLTASGQTLGAATSLSSDFQDDPYDGLMGMAYQSISTLGASPLFQTLVAQDKVANSQFSFYLAEDGSELFLGGMNPALYKAGSTRAYPVVSQSYWLLATQANVAGKPVSAVGTFNSIVDTGTSVIVAPTQAAQKFWAAVPNSGVYGSGYYTFPCASAPEISFSFGAAFGEQWALSGESLNLGKVSSGSDRCVGAIVGADIGINAWILGASFLENVYSTFDLSTNSVSFSDLA
ncbi:hypothetical protein JCM10449v2_005057 [Rhodotorula kratochvilovae]